MVPRWFVCLLIVALLLMPLAAAPLASVRAADEPTPTVVVDETATPTPPDPAPTATPEPSGDDATPAATESPTATATATAPPTATPTETSTAIETPATETATTGATPTDTATIAGSPTATATAPSTATATPVPTPKAATIAAACTLSPTSGAVGRSILVTCTGFVPRETVNIYWYRSSSSIVRASFVADGAGAGGGTFAAPNAAAGIYPVIAKGMTSGAKAMANFTVKPSLSLSVRNGVVGTNSRVTLSGFGASESVEVRWYHRATSSTVLATITTSRTGGGSAWITVPRTPAGGHAVAGAGSGHQAQQTFTVVPDLQLSPANGRVGSSVTAKLYGFGRAETVDIRFFVAGSSSQTVASVTTSSTGTGKATFAVPRADEGAHRVLASGNQGNSASRTYTVEVPGERWVEVNLSTQYMTVWQGDTVVNGTYVSTGRPGFDTPTGTYQILVKYVSQTMEGVIGGEYYYVPDVPWVMYFTNYGHAIHGAYWHNNFGYVMSHGCINLPTYNTPGWSYDFAEWLFYWLPYGARVVIHY